MLCIIYFQENYMFLFLYKICMLIIYDNCTGLKNVVFFFKYSHSQSIFCLKISVGSDSLHKGFYSKIFSVCKGINNTYLLALIFHQCLGDT